LNKNRLTSVNRENFFNLSKLTELHLENNELQVILPFTFSYLTSLEYLHLQANSIEFIEMNSFHGLNSLKYLYLNSNNIRFLSAYNFYFAFDLRILDLSFNNISAIHEFCFSTNTDIQKLFFKGNPIERVNRTAFENSAIKLFYLTRASAFENALDAPWQFYVVKHMKNEIIYLQSFTLTDESDTFDCELTIRFLKYNLLFNLASNYDFNRFFNLCGIYLD